MADVPRDDLRRYRFVGPRAPRPRHLDVWVFADAETIWNAVLSCRGWFLGLRSIPLRGTSVQHQGRV